MAQKEGPNSTFDTIIRRKIGVKMGEIQKRGKEKINQMRRGSPNRGQKLSKILRNLQKFVKNAQENGKNARFLTPIFLGAALLIDFSR